MQSRSSRSLPEPVCGIASQEEFVAWPEQLSFLLGSSPRGCRLLAHRVT
jgi:hypothetical protein